MVRKGPSKKRDETFVRGRLLIARGFLKDARNSNAVADPGDIGNPSMSTIINCAIAIHAARQYGSRRAGLFLLP
ncbi:hypothetical protein F4V88_22035 [Neorhizobium galegae]|nr:hypothetical protein F4V88_22035 [Neorhizobium galegae]